MLLIYAITTCKVRPAGHPINDKTNATNDDDSVELEKSNILLMGPTGSGNLFLL